MCTNKSDSSGINSRNQPYSHDRSYNTQWMNAQHFTRSKLHLLSRTKLPQFMVYVYIGHILTITTGTENCPVSGGLGSSLHLHRKDLDL